MPLIELRPFIAAEHG